MNFTKVGSLYGSVNYYGETSLIREMGLTEPRSFLSSAKFQQNLHCFVAFKINITGMKLFGKSRAYSPRFAATRRLSPDFLKQICLPSDKSTRMHRYAPRMGVKNGRRWVWIPFVSSWFIEFLRKPVSGSPSRIVASLHVAQLITFDFFRWHSQNPTAHERTFILKL